MDKMKKICAWVTAGLITLVAVLLIVSCVRIYSSGSRPFTREVITAYAEELMLPGILCLAAVIVGLLLPNTAEKTKALRDQESLLRRYDSRLPSAQKEQARRRNGRRIYAIFCAAMAVYPVVYLTDSSHFRVTDVNGDVLRAAIVVLVPTLLVMALGLFLQHRALHSISREIEIYRSNGIKPGNATEKQRSDPKKLAVLRCILLVAGIVLVCVGALNGGAADVLGKAIRICTECIGLG